MAQISLLQVVKEDLFSNSFVYLRKEGENEESFDFIIFGPDYF